MTYDDDPSLNALYGLIATLFEDRDDAESALTIADGMITLGEQSSWASVWWAYGAIHCLLNDSAYARALHLLSRVDRSPQARAAALMLTAEIQLTTAVESERAPDAAGQCELLEEAVAAEPEWPGLRLRAAVAQHSVGNLSEAKRHADAAIGILEQSSAGNDAFGSAISGTTLSLGYVVDELAGLGLFRPD